MKKAVTGTLLGWVIAASPLVLGASLPVSTIEIQSEQSFESIRVYAGQTVAARASALGFNRGGEISSVHVDVGESVKPGDVLASLDDRGVAARHRQAEADLAVAEANVIAVQAQARLALNTAARFEGLSEDGHVSMQGLDEARQVARSRGAELNVAKANLARANAALEVAAVAVSESRVVAPFAGIVQGRYVDEGAQVQPAQPVLRLVESRKVEAHIGVPSATARLLDAGETYIVRVDGRQITSSLRSVLPEVDPASRTQTAVFTLKGEDVPVGAVAELVFANQVAGQGFWLPVSALTAMDKGLWGVYVVTHEQVLERRLVEVIHSESERVFARGTLSAGDRIVERGVQRLVPGQKVTVTPLVAERS